MKLWDLRVNQKAKVTKVNLDCEQSRIRLNDLGFQEGQSLVCVQHTPLNGPRTFQITSGVFALESEVANFVEVEIEVEV